jgi:hypothetical protein
MTYYRKPLIKVLLYAGAIRCGSLIRCKFGKVAVSEYEVLDLIFSAKEFLLYRQ